MKNLGKLGTPLSKQEQKKIMGADGGMCGGWANCYCVGEYHPFGYSFYGNCCNLAQDVFNACGRPADWSCTYMSGCVEP